MTGSTQTIILFCTQHYVSASHVLRDHAVMPVLFNSLHVSENSILLHSLLLASNDSFQHPERTTVDSQDPPKILLQLYNLEFLRNSYEPFANYKTSLLT